METATENPDIKCYYCICSQFILAITPGLDVLPRRNAQVSEDKSIVISRKRDQCVFSLDAYRDKYPLLVTNKNKEEVWWVYKCPRCKLPIGYDLENSSQQYTFILNGALHEEPSEDQVTNKES
ncbi:uncharacterized protein SAPINGB_P002999 [Magnusiomyces paraingens]|uniref:STEEP1 domain-containing protein n=1 Tax=Magnusiomyces paraingens TaxID=2606893 RepID=A0A5E8BHK0_9ASCO|nr:uncharacterized protein SAPINGB_P002999 [Saprochaete ingens]VVT51146.1 unnamed protein product [Saprochaete ingens]